MRTSSLRVRVVGAAERGAGRLGSAWAEWRGAVGAPAGIDGGRGRPDGETAWPGGDDGRLFDPDGPRLGYRCDGTGGREVRWGPERRDYPPCMWLSGAPGSAKTYAAQLVAGGVLRGGGRVLVVDSSGAGRGGEYLGFAARAAEKLPALKVRVVRVDGSDAAVSLDPFRLFGPDPRHDDEGPGPGIGHRPATELDGGDWGRCRQWAHGVCALMAGCDETSAEWWTVAAAVDEVAGRADPSIGQVVEVLAARGDSQIAARLAASAATAAGSVIFGPGGPLDVDGADLTVFDCGGLPGGSGRALGVASRCCPADLAQQMLQICSAEGHASAAVRYLVAVIARRFAAGTGEVSRLCVFDSAVPLLDCAAARCVLGDIGRCARLWGAQLVMVCDTPGDLGVLGDLCGYRLAFCPPPGEGVATLWAVGVERSRTGDDMFRDFLAGRLPRGVCLAGDPRGRYGYVRIAADDDGVAAGAGFGR